MAIAFDNSAVGGANVASYNFTVNNANSTLLVSVFTADGANVSNVTYKNTPMVLIATAVKNSGKLFVFGINSGAQVAATIAITTSSSSFDSIASAYSGTDQVNLFDSAAGAAQSSSSVLKVNITVIAQNCWIMPFSAVQASASAGGNTGNTSRNSDTFVTGQNYILAEDTNATVSTGLHQISLNPTGTTVSDANLILVALAPLGSTLGINASDSVTVSESIQIIEIFKPSVSDSISHTENVQLVIVDKPFIFDSVSHTESVQITIIDKPFIFDTISFSEFVNITLTPIFISVSDSVTVSELLVIMEIDQGLVVDAILVSETIQIEITSFEGVFENITVSEFVSIAVVTPINAGEFTIRLGWQQANYILEADEDEFGLNLGWHQGNYNINPPGNS